MRGKPRGKPQGGTGGGGGDVILRADPSVATLLRYDRRPHHRAGDGTHGSGDLRHGKRGSDLVLSVPLGTVVAEQDGTVLADLVEAGSEVVVLRGGRGGRGNADFVSPALRAPEIAEQGEYGPEAWFTLELKLAADAALIGFPNAGKSTLISRVSAAKPKIADYPFTTLSPHLGVVSFDDREFVLADIPGLIEGAAAGKGLGHEFLRHVERARALVVLLDPSPLQEHAPAEQLRILLGELERYQPDLLDRPRLAVIGKMDLAEAAEALSSMPDAIGLSSLTGDGLTEFLHLVAAMVEESRRVSPDRPGYLLHRPVEDDFAVKRDGPGWIVEGRAALRAVAFADLTVASAAAMAADRLRKLGVDKALEAAGAAPGDTVRIGELEFEFQPSETAPELGHTHL
jgi:GTP-binding protein